MAKRLRLQGFCKGGPGGPGGVKGRYPSLALEGFCFLVPFTKACARGWIFVKAFMAFPLDLGIFAQPNSTALGIFTYTKIGTRAYSSIGNPCLS